MAEIIAKITEKFIEGYHLMELNHWISNCQIVPMNNICIFVLLRSIGMGKSDSTTFKVVKTWINGLTVKTLLSNYEAIYRF